MVPGHFSAAIGVRKGCQVARRAGCCRRFDLIFSNQFQVPPRISDRFRVFPIASSSFLASNFDCCPRALFALRQLLRSSATPLPHSSATPLPRSILLPCSPETTCGLSKLLRSPLVGWPRERSSFHQHVFSGRTHHFLGSLLGHHSLTPMSIWRRGCSQTQMNPQWQ